jgi:hypothetical protein
LLLLHAAIASASAPAAANLPIWLNPVMTGEVSNDRPQFFCNSISTKKSSKAREHSDFCQFLALALTSGKGPSPCRVALFRLHQRLSHERNPVNSSRRNLTVDLLSIAETPTFNQW